jgi:hypothetical protein
LTCRESDAELCKTGVMRAWGNGGRGFHGLDGLGPTELDTGREVSTADQHSERKKERSAKGVLAGSGIITGIAYTFALK